MRRVSERNTMLPEFRDDVGGKLGNANSAGLSNSDPEEQVRLFEDGSSLHAMMLVHAEANGKFPSKRLKDNKMKKGVSGGTHIPLAIYTLRAQHPGQRGSYCGRRWQEKGHEQVRYV